MESNSLNALQQEISALKKSRNAVILAHNYVRPEIQDIADFCGDSLELSIRAKELGAELLVFCGVSFMAETAKILSYGSRVLLPVPEAGCPMADMVDIRELKEFKASHPDALLAAYVNTTAATKALIDICCTSANADKIISSLPADREVMFLPDRNLGQNVIDATQRKMSLWHGCCPIHDQVTPEMILKAKSEHPGCPVLIHPECPPQTLALADYAVSTGKMLKVVKDDPAPGFIVATEHGIIHRLKKENPDREFYPVSPLLVCEDMKKITLESVRDALKYDQYEVKLDADLAENAQKAIVRMLDVK